MQLPFLDPMFDPRVPILGAPSGALVFAVAIVGLVVGFLWIRRITSGEPEYRSFRATTRPEHTTLLAGAALAAIAMSIVLAVFAGVQLVRLLGV